LYHHGYNLKKKKKETKKKKNPNIESNLHNTVFLIWLYLPYN